MAKYTPSETYFNWMRKIIKDASPVPYHHDCILRHLHETPFTWNNAMDECRATDGIDLRFEYGYHVGLSDEYVEKNINFTKCSILEMMFALALRVETNTMTNDKFGDRTGVWVWVMLANLGFDSCTDDIYDPEIVNEMIENFLRGEVGHDGEGGMFYVENCPRDMSKMDIWYQCMTYLSTLNE